MKRATLILIQFSLFLSIVSTSVSAHSEPDIPITSCVEALVIARQFKESGVYEQLYAMSEKDCMAIVDGHTFGSFTELIASSMDEPLLVDVTDDGVIYTKRPNQPDAEYHSEELDNIPRSTLEGALWNIEFLQLLLDAMKDLFRRLFSALCPTEVSLSALWELWEESETSKSNSVAA